ncbi:unnamed protein product [Choristocarpus tenellus]
MELCASAARGDMCMVLLEMSTGGDWKGEKALACGGTPYTQSKGCNRLKGNRGQHPSVEGLWSWLGGTGEGRCNCSADFARAGICRGGRGVSSGYNEWRGAFRNGMAGVQRRKAFKTARGKVYLKNRPLLGRVDSPPLGSLDPVLEEEESIVSTPS